MVRVPSLVTFAQRSFVKWPRHYTLVPKRAQSGLSYLHQAGSSPLKYTTLGETLRASADRWPGRPALISKHQQKTVTYEELLLESQKLAAALRNSGMEKGDRLGIWLQNCTEWVVAMMAAAQCGLVSVAINHVYGAYEIEYALQKVGVKALLAPGSRVSARHYQVLCDVIPELPGSQGALESHKLANLKTVIMVGDDGSPGTISYENFLERSSTETLNQLHRDLALICPDDECNIQYTSGTTGMPKAPMLSHHNIVNNGYAVGLRNEIENKKICVQVPLFHVFGVVATISAGLQHGATMVLPSFIYSPKANLAALREEKCDVIHGTPTMYVDLVNELRSQGAGSTGLFSEVAVTGGAPITPKLVQDMAASLNVRKVKSVFGMTETTAVHFQSLADEDKDRPLHYLGKLHDFLEAKVVNEEGKMVPFGQAGELLIRGYSVMKQYWGDEEKTKEVLDENGWIKTGDQVTLHEDGYAKLTGRIKDLIIRGGENVAPKEIEDVMSTHPDVLECQVFGVHDDRLGEEVCAAVRVREGATFAPEALARHVAEKLSRHKVPKILKQVQQYPKTASGKVQKFKLRQMVEAGTL